MKSMTSASRVLSAAFVALLLVSGAFASEASAPQAPLLLCDPSDSTCATEKSHLVEQTKPGLIKWNPGHYMMQMGASTQATRFAHYDQISSNTSIEGVVLWLRWGWVESAMGTYDFSIIEEELKKLNSLKVPKRLFIRMMTLNYGINASCSGGRYFPAYIVEQGGCVQTGDQSSGNKFFSVKWWDARTTDRYIAMLEAMAARFDGHPLFEGIVVNRETALGNTTLSAPGYTLSGYVRELKRVSLAAKKAFATSNVILFTNYLANGLSPTIELLDWQRDNGIGQGHPDVAPICVQPSDVYCPYGFESIQGIWADNIVKKNSSGGTGPSMIGKVPIVASVEVSQLGTNSVGQRGGYVPQVLFDYCDGWATGCTHIFWHRNVDFGTDEQRWNTGILPVIEKNQAITNSACPSSHLARGGCLTGTW